MIFDVRAFWLAEYNVTEIYSVITPACSDH